jgi:hypothetical protein
MVNTLSNFPGWSQARKNLERWWNNEGLAVYLWSWKNDFRPPEFPPVDLETFWLDPVYRGNRSEKMMHGLTYFAEGFPVFDSNIGPGSLGLFLGAGGHLAETTVWYTPSIADPETCPPLIFDPTGNPWWQHHVNLIDEGIRRQDGDFLVGMPDLIENLDTLAALRGDQVLLIDLIERPSWVRERLAEINQAFFTVFDILYEKMKDAWNGNAFCAFKIWGPGKTAKIQCDFSAMISARMFRSLAQPYFIEQCKFLDYSLYHLDGTTALQHVDALLEIPNLNAIEWTPQAGKPGGGAPEWYDLYRRIKAGGKGVQVLVDSVGEVIPLLDAIGPKGTFILMTKSATQKEAEMLMKQLEPYYKE